jgi:hypothetical protein
MVWRCPDIPATTKLAKQKLSDRQRNAAARLRQSKICLLMIQGNHFQQRAKTMTDKMQILNLIATVAKKLGRAPSLTEFASRTGISRYSFSKCFAKWNDPVRAAGLQPSSLYVRPENGELLEDWGRTVRERRGLVSRRGYQLQGEYEARTLERRFEGWSSVPEAFRNFAKEKPEWADVVAILPAGAGNQECEGPKEATSRPIVPGKSRARR